MLNTKMVNPAALPVAVVGTGLMGTSIAACLLIAGHPVFAVECEEKKRRSALRRLRALLEESRREGLAASDPHKLVNRFQISSDYSILADTAIVFECVIEDVEIKRQVIWQVEQVVSRSTLIGSNTSAIPITCLQAGARHPERILGIHWGEPAHISRFMEITCGAQTRPVYATRVSRLAQFWGKEPSVLRKDIRGFISNRIMYAMIREAFFLVESGVATIADVDRSLRNDLGYWITFAGPFRFMDLTGIPAYAAVMRDLLPELSNSTEVPELMRQVIAAGAQGVANAKGFYRYTPAQARRWEHLFHKFTYEIRALSMKYSDAAAYGGKRQKLRCSKD